MFHVVLHQPEIPPNTGNIIRLCANTGAHLHVVEPMGFVLSDKTLKRAGMDYRLLSVVTQHPDWETCCAALAGQRMFAMTTHGTYSHAQAEFKAGDVFVFGAESCGLPDSVRAQFPSDRCLRIPMREGSRSLNLSNSVAVVVYEAWRQQGFVLGT